MPRILEPFSDCFCLRDHVWSDLAGGDPTPPGALGRRHGGTWLPAHVAADPARLAGFADFVVGGVLWGYIRTVTRYALFFLYPYVIFAAIAPLAWCAGAFIAYQSNSAVVGIATLSPCCMPRRAAGFSY